jgi:hydrogenase maturation factor
MNKDRQDPVQDPIGVRFTHTRTHPGDSLRPELTPVSNASCELDAEGHCITCSDEALHVRVLSIDQENGVALVAVDDASEEIDVTLVDHVEAGDILLVHGGVAIARVDEADNA